MRTALPVEEREFIMEAREWFERFQAERMQQAEERGLLRGQNQGKLEGQIQNMARLCEIRLGRSLTDAEHAALASRFDRVGPDRIGQVVLSFSAEALGAWLANPHAE